MNSQHDTLFNLDGEVAVVTGAQGKLGPVWTGALLAAGARVAALDLPGAKLSAAWAAWPSSRTSRDRWSFSHPAPRLTSPASSSASMVAIPRGDDAMTPFNFPDLVRNWIDGEPRAAVDRRILREIFVTRGRALYRVSRSRDGDVAAAVAAARQAQVTWAAMPAVRRGAVLHDVAMLLRARREDIAHCVHLETGKSIKDALGETDGAIAQGVFMAGEGQRLYGRTTPSAVANKYASTVREAMGVAGLVIAANTPVANVAWKVFPALICGNAAVLKAAEDTPFAAYLFAELAEQAGLPRGVLNVVHGYGIEAGEPLVTHPDVTVISFTGSTAVGRRIATLAGQRLAKVSLELGGKNPLLVCDDADLDLAVKWTLLSAFSYAGQRCAAASRVIVFDAIYDRFRERLLAGVNTLRVG